MPNDHQELHGIINQVSLATLLNDNPIGLQVVHYNEVRIAGQRITPARREQVQFALAQINKGEVVYSVGGLLWKSVDGFLGERHRPPVDLLGTFTNGDLDYQNTMQIHADGTFFPSSDASLVKVAAMISPISKPGVLDGIVRYVGNFRQTEHELYQAREGGSIPNIDATLFTDVRDMLEDGGVPIDPENIVRQNGRRKYVRIYRDGIFI